MKGMREWVTRMALQRVTYYVACRGMDAESHAESATLWAHPHRTASRATGQDQPEYEDSSQKTSELFTRGSIMLLDLRTACWRNGAGRCVTGTAFAVLEHRACPCALAAT